MKINFKKIYKLPAFILSSVLFLICVISLIVGCARNVSMGKYKYSDVEDDIAVENIMTFINKKEAYLESISRHKNGDISVSKFDYEYKVVDGRLFIKDELSSRYEEVGKINSTKIKIKEDGMTATFTNGGAIASIVISSVFVAIFALCGVVTGLYTFKGDKILNKKEGKQIESKEEKQAEAENK